MEKPSSQLPEKADVAILLASSLMMVSKNSQTDRRKLATDFVSSVIDVDPKSRKLGPETVMVLGTHVMRLALASVALICGAATCLAKSPTSKYCSDGFDETGKPAELVFFENGPEFRLRGKTTNLAEGNPFWVESMTFGKIDFWTEGIEYRDQEIIIYKDRAFWPCRKN